MSLSGFLKNKLFYVFALAAIDVLHCLIAAVFVAMDVMHDREAFLICKTDIGTPLD